MSLPHTLGQSWTDPTHEGLQQGPEQIVARQRVECRAPACGEPSDGHVMSASFCEATVEAQEARMTSLAMTAIEQGSARGYVNMQLEYPCHMHWTRGRFDTQNEINRTAYFCHEVHRGAAAQRSCPLSSVTSLAPETQTALVAAGTG